ncbi:hypothetical protein ACR9E3_13150 [Actinomycetospora sp. C-140]
MRLLPGQLAADVTAVAPRLAPALGAARLVVEPRGLMYIRLHLLSADPLDEVVTLVPSAPPGLVGYSEHGQAVVEPVHRRPHAVCQGQTRSGKSMWTYGQLSAIAGTPDVLVAGIDPTGLLWRPWSDSRHAEWQVSGLSEDLGEHLDLLVRLCAEMDRRLSVMPAGHDVLPLDADTPAVVVVLEELAGLYRVADMQDRKTGTRIRMLVGRLLAEGHKVGFRCLLIVQRADAAVIDGLSRAQCGLRVSFSVSDAEAVRMLHPAAVDVSDVLGALPGVGLLTAPGVSLLRFRAPLLSGGYGEYCARVSEAVGRA